MLDNGRSTHEIYLNYVSAWEEETCKIVEWEMNDSSDKQFMNICHKMNGCGWEISRQVKCENGNKWLQIVNE